MLNSKSTSLSLVSLLSSSSKIVSQAKSTGVEPRETLRLRWRAFGFSPVSTLDTERSRPAVRSDSTRACSIYDPLTLSKLIPSFELGGPIIPSATLVVVDQLSRLGGGGGILAAPGMIASFSSLTAVESVKEDTTCRLLIGFRSVEGLMGRDDDDDDDDDNELAALPLPSSMILACRATREHTKQTCC